MHAQSLLSSYGVYIHWKKFFLTSLSDNTIWGDLVPRKTQIANILTPTSRISGARTGELWSMKGKHFWSALRYLPISKICYVFAATDSPCYSIWRETHTIKQWKLSKKKKKSSKMLPQILHCQYGKEERSVTFRYWTLCWWVKFTKGMPILIPFILLLVRVFRKKIVSQACLHKTNFHYIFAGSGCQWIIGCEDGSNDHLLLMLWLNNLKALMLFFFLGGEGSRFTVKAGRRSFRMPRKFL